MNQLSARRAGWIYSFIHFSVELACFWLLFSRCKPSPLWWALALLYDALAFVPQLFIGLLQDRFPRFMGGVAGCILIIAALFIPSGTLSLVLMSIGNAFVHVDGAQKTLNSPDGRIAPCGIFVGGGSFGVIAGQLLASCSFAGVVILPCVFMAASLLLTIYAARRFAPESDGAGFCVANNIPLPITGLLMFIAVAARAYIGYAIPTDWNKTALQALMLFVCMGAGKMLGGILADRIGYRKTALISLGLALPFLLFGNSVMVISLIGVGLFSMTMPLTIGILASRLPGQSCAAFGITTVALFAGTLPAFFVMPGTLFAHQAVVLLLSAAALLCILPTVRKGC